MDNCPSYQSSYGGPEVGATQPSKFNRPWSPEDGLKVTLKLDSTAVGHVHELRSRKSEAPGSGEPLFNPAAHYTEQIPNGLTAAGPRR